MTKPQHIPMKMMQLGEILTPEQMKGVIDIIESCRGQSVSTMRVKKLKEHLSQFSTELEAKGVNADYLAYAIEYALQGRGQELVEEIEQQQSHAE